MAAGRSKQASSRTRVLLVDDHPVVRQGIRSSLRGIRDIKVVGEASDGEEAVRKSGGGGVDVVLMDISLPGKSGLQAAQAIRRRARRAAVVFLTMHADPEYVQEAVAAGASGYVLKDAPPEDLIRAIRAAKKGEAFFSPGVSKHLFEKPHPGARKNRKGSTSKLTSREEQVLTRIARGLANKEIAAQLGIGVRTVETHRERIMRKLGIHNAAGLTRFAINHGLA